MRVTMLVRCLAMMRGGGETRHLAWQRELTALGVEVDIITGQPLLVGAPKHPVTGLPATMIRSPYLRDAVYRWQHQRGFGRLTMTALHLDEEWFCRSAWRRIAERSHPPDIVHAHALYQAARLRRNGIAVVINFPGAPNARYLAVIHQADALVADGWAASNLSSMLGRSVHPVAKGWTRRSFGPEDRVNARSLGSEGRASCCRWTVRSDQTACSWSEWPACENRIRRCTCLVWKDPKRRRCAGRSNVSVFPTWCRLPGTCRRSACPRSTARQMCSLFHPSSTILRMSCSRRWRAVFPLSRPMSAAFRNTSWPVVAEPSWLGGTRP